MAYHSEMADYPPFMNAYGLIPKILSKIKEAKTPGHFTQDFLANTLGFDGGSEVDPEIRTRG